MKALQPARGGDFMVSLDAAQRGNIQRIAGSGSIPGVSESRKSLKPSRGIFKATSDSSILGIEVYRQYRYAFFLI